MRAEITFLGCDGSWASQVWNSHSLYLSLNGAYVAVQWIHGDLFWDENSNFSVELLRGTS